MIDRQTGSFVKDFHHRGLGDYLANVFAAWT